MDFLHVRIMIRLQRTRRETSRSSDGSRSGTPLTTPTPCSATGSPLKGALLSNGHSLSVESEIAEQQTEADDSTLPVAAEEADSKSKLLDDGNVRNFFCNFLNKVVFIQ